MGKHKLDSLFASQLQNRQQQPSSRAWEAIAGELAKKERQGLWWWLSMAASLLLVIASSWYIITAPTATGPVYSYADERPAEPLIPKKIILVPVIINPTSLATGREPVSAQENSQGSYPVVNQPDNNDQIVVAGNPTLAPKLNPIIREPLPEERTASEEMVMASAREQQQPQKTVPVTIVYKQGKPEPKSNFTRALNYLGEVRTGEKKLFDLNKIRKKLKQKVTSKRTTNSK